MDDRSATCQTLEQLQDLDHAMKSDKDVSFQEHQKKRQLWTRADQPPTPVEHLGATAMPANPTHPILPRLGWDKLQSAALTLGSAPGSTEVKLRLAIAYI